MATLETNLEAYWDCDVAGATIVDSVNSYTLTKDGTVTTGSANGPGGRDCLDCGAALGKYRTADLARLFDYSLGFTANIWVYAAAQSPVGNWVFGQRKSAGGARYWAMRGPHASNGLSGGTLDASTLRMATSSDFTTGEWVMLTMTDDGTTANVYKNAGSSIGSDTTVLATIDTVACDFAIGGIPWASGTSTSTSHQGRIALAGVWSRVLTAAEKTLLYNSGNGRDSTELNVSVSSNLLHSFAVTRSANY